MAYNTSDGGATRLYDAVGGRHLEALRERRGLESVSLRIGVVVGASNWRDWETGARV